MKKLLTLLLILIGSVMLSSCRTQKPIVQQSVIDSVFLETIYSNLEKNYVSKSYVEKVRESVIDSMRRVALPVEQSTAIVPVSQHSYLSTSLSESKAWVDTSGYLNHTLINKDSASLLYREVTSTITIEKKDSTDVRKLKEMFYKGVQYKQKDTTVYVPPNQKFLENWFYYSGIAVYILIIVLTVLKMRSDGILTSIFSVIKNLFSSIISLFKKK